MRQHELATSGDVRVMMTVPYVVPSLPRQAYDDDHDKEAALFDHLGRLLAEVKAFAR